MQPIDALKPLAYALAALIAAAVQTPGANEFDACATTDKR